jgi:hypothetical protein
MRTPPLAAFFLAFCVAGCAGNKGAGQPARAQRTLKGAPPAATGSLTNQALIVTLESALVGKVALVNLTGRFVVLSFPLGKMAVPEQRLGLYRQGLKVGEVKITGPARGDNIVADLVAGEAEVGDDARSQ